MDLSAETISAIAGAALSLLFAYLPGLSGWFTGLTGDYKRLVMAGSLLLTCGVILGLSCASLLNWVTCDQSGIVKMVTLFVSALIGNQTAYTFVVNKPTGDLPCSSSRDGGK